MNILILTQHFSKSGGGSEITMSNLARKLSSRGHNVFVICQKQNIGDAGDEENVIPERLNILGVNPSLPHKGQLSPSIRHNLEYITSSLIKGFKVIRKYQIDIIHSNSYSSIVAGSILSKLNKVPMVSTIHDVFTTYSTEAWKLWAKQNEVSFLNQFIGKRFERIVIKMPSSIIHSVSDATKSDILEINPKAKIRVIPNGIELSDYETSKPIEYEKFILFIGRLVFYKNLDVIISYFSTVLGYVPEAKLVVVGDGPMRNKWEMMVKDLNLEGKVQFTGKVSNTVKLELLRTCSSLILPSTFEGFGLVILESYAMSKPVLVANVEPFDEIVSDQVDGFLVALDNKDGWVNNMVSLLLDTAQCRVMGMRGRKKVESNFKMDSVADRMESLYRSLLAKQYR